MILSFFHFTMLGMAAIPLIYYSLALFSAWQFFAKSQKSAPAKSYTPPVSNLKPIRGLDPDAYENFASFCRQDYPEYEIVFCVGDASEPALPVIQRLIRDFPECQIRVLIGSGRVATNDKVAKLARLSAEAKYETVVMSDSDVRVQPDYLRTIVAGMADPKVGAVTCFYAPVPSEEKSFVQRVQSVGMLSDFYAGILVARQLDGVKFALGPTIATTRTRLAGFGGYAAIENRPADDLLVGRLIAEQGYEVQLLNYSIQTVSDFHSLRDLFLKRLRWTVVMRIMRPWGHLGLIFTLGLPWALAAIFVQPTPEIIFAYLSAYFAFRIAMMEVIGRWGLKQPGIYKKLWLLPVWDLLATSIWLVSFTRNSIRWRDGYYYIRNGELVPVDPRAAAIRAAEKASERVVHSDV
jgi:ceramide glucosyltransferase